MLKLKCQGTTNTTAPKGGGKANNKASTGSCDGVVEVEWSAATGVVGVTRDEQQRRDTRRGRDRDRDRGQDRVLACPKCGASMCRVVGEVDTCVNRFADGETVAILEVDPEKRESTLDDLWDTTDRLCQVLPLPAACPPPDELNYIL